jgi:hypothetical protein
MHGRVTLCLIVAALGILVASPAVLAATPTTPTPTPPSPTPSSGGGSSGINCAPLATSCTLYAGSSGSSGDSGGGTTTVTCTWQGPLSALTTEDETLLLVVYGDWETSTSTDPDNYVVTCTPVLDDEVGEWLAEVWPQPPVAPTPGQVGQTAESELNLPAPTVSTAPSGGKAIVNLESWMWIDPADWTPITKSATADGITATATATPISVVWDMGDGNQVTCDGPGVAYNTNIPDADESTTCGYTYQETSANGPDQKFTITTAIEYDVTWTSVGVAGGGDLGIILGASTPTLVTVDEIGTVTVPNP